MPSCIGPIIAFSLIDRFFWCFLDGCHIGDYSVVICYKGGNDRILIDLIIKADVGVGVPDYLVHN